ncbi:hypothetical protein LWT71_23300, partial [Enterobacter hormaechei]|nr:hypothetical protein [Enterobacter hormaechei]
WKLAGRIQRTAAYPDTREDSCFLPSSLGTALRRCAITGAAPPVTVDPGFSRVIRSGGRSAVSLARKTHDGQTAVVSYN